MSSSCSNKALALVLVGPGRRIAAVEAAAREFVRFVPSAQLEQALPPSVLVFVSGGEDDPEFVEKVTRLRGRYRERGWYVLTRRDRFQGAEAVFGEAIEGALIAPLSREVLAQLARARAELIVARRCASRRKGRIDQLEERLVLLSDTIQAAGSLLDPRMVTGFIMERAGQLVGARRWRLYRVDEGAGVLRLDAWEDPHYTRQPEPELALDQGIAGWTARYRCIGRFSGAPGEAQLDWRAEWPGRPPQSLISVPLVSRGRVIGVAEFGDPACGPRLGPEVETVGALMEPAAIALDNAQLFRKLEERTVTDDLTQLYNARFMDNYLRREAKRAARYGHPVSLLFLDLDGFKVVNDTHGHMAGSRTLVEVGQVLRENVREIDVAARWGGDEFTVVLPETARAGASAMAERLCQRIRERSFLEDLGLSVRISASIGVASWPENGPSAATLLAGADAAMYHVKNNGKDGVYLAPPTGADALVEA